MIRSNTITVEHTRNGHRFVFSYDRGEQRRLVECLARLAQDPGSPLDWFDTALVLHQADTAEGRGANAEANA